jgi:formamidopyrimidine-DNA glycosylase
VPEILEVEAARAVLEALALRREIAAVHAPDSWFLKRGTTSEALRATLVGEAFTVARRRGKSMFVDTSGGPVLGLHLGMSGRVIIDERETASPRPQDSGARSRPVYVEAGDPLIYASNRVVDAWHRFGVHFADGGAFMLRDPRRLGAVELDPDESRLGPDALTLTFAELDHAFGGRTAPVKAVLMDQARVAGLGNLLTDEALWRAGVDPAQAAGELDRDARRRLYRAVRDTLRILGRRGGSHTGNMPRGAAAVCPKDGTPLARRTVAGRTTYSCPLHQRRPSTPLHR